MSHFMILFDNQPRARSAHWVRPQSTTYDTQQMLLSSLYDETANHHGRDNRPFRDPLMSSARQRPLSSVECIVHTAGQDQCNDAVEQSGWDADEEDVPTPPTFIGTRVFRRTRSFIPTSFMERIEELPEGVPSDTVVRKKRALTRLSVFVGLLSRKRR